MKITMYELLGLVKDGKAPKKIMYNNIVWEYVNHEQDYRSRHNAELFFNDEINNTWIMTHLNTQIEILEEAKEIPEKLEEFGLIRYNLDYIDYKNIETLKEWLNKDFQTIYDTIDLIIKNQNKLIDYLKSKGDE